MTCETGSSDPATCSSRTRAGPRRVQAPETAAGRWGRRGHSAVQHNAHSPRLRTPKHEHSQSMLPPPSDAMIERDLPKFGDSSVFWASFVHFRFDPKQVFILATRVRSAHLAYQPLSCSTAGRACARRSRQSSSLRLSSSEQHGTQGSKVAADRCKETS